MKCSCLFRHFDNVLTNIERTMSDMTIKITRPHATNAIVYVSIFVINQLHELSIFITLLLITTILDHIGSCVESRFDLQRNYDRMGYSQRVR